ncbi:heparinase II/III family protein [Candidatus Shapirobacteria bacterium]|nr:heparinase II/III family protein [Candidatus Shapirobacteria bacterium]
MKRFFFLSTLFFLSSFFFWGVSKSWAKEHPYLLFEAGEINSIKSRLGNEPYASAFARLTEVKNCADSSNVPDSCSDWPDLLLGLSFKFVLTGERYYFQQAAFLLDKALDSKKLDPVTTTYPAWDYGGWVRAYALAYDWLYQELKVSNPGLLNQLKQELQVWVNKIATRSGGLYLASGEGVKARNNSTLTTYGGIGLALLALENEEAIDNLWLIKVKNQVKNNGFSLSGPGGNYQEGFHYQAFGLPKVLTFAVAYQRIKGEDLISGTSLEKIINWFLYSRTSATQFLSYADPGESARPVTLLPGEYLYLINRNQDAVGKWFWDQAHPQGWQNKSPFYAEFYYPSILLWYPPSLAAKSPEQKSYAQSYFFKDHLTLLPSGRNSGLVVLRNGFLGSDLVLSFINRFTYQGHQHYDPLSFTLSAYGEDLVVDLAPHNYNQEDRGVDHEHNLVVIDLPPWPQINAGSGITGMAFSGRHPSQLGFIDQFFTDQSLDFTKGDARYPYADISKDKNGQTTSEFEQILLSQINPILKAERSIMFIKNPAHPYFIITDDIQKGQAAHSYSWLLHTRFSNITGQGKTTDPLSINTALQSLRIYFLSPEDFSKNVVDYLGDHKVIEIKKTGVINPYFITLLYPQKPSQPAPRVSQEIGPLIVGEITWPEAMDYYLFNKRPGVLSSNGQWATDGHSAYFHLVNSQPSQYFIHQVSLLKRGGAELIKINDQEKVNIFYDGTKIKIIGANFKGGLFFAPGISQVLVNDQPVSFSREDDYILINALFPTPSCSGSGQGNLNCDSEGLVDELDLALILSGWGQPGKDEVSLNVLLSNWKTN